MPRNIGVLWDSEVDWEGETPFKKDYMDDTYQKFSSLASEQEGKVFIAKFSWYSENGLDKAYYFDSGWKKVEGVEVDVVFDKFKFDEKTRELKKEINSELPVLNDFELERICKDKLLTYDFFPELVPETVEADEETVEEFIFEDGKAVVKPIYDFGGNGVEVLEKPLFEEKDDLIVQRFVDSSLGIETLNIEGFHDLRVIVVNGEKQLALVRTPEEGFISNVSRGGSMEFVSVEDLPEKAVEAVDAVVERFQRFEPAVYSVDLIFDKGQKPWILELNSKPGLVFYDDLEIERNKTPLMEKIVEILVSMS